MFLYWFSRFNDRFEKKVYKTLHRINEKTPNTKVQKKFTKLLSQDLIRTLIILEWKFKGYTHLNKKRRSDLYKNCDQITKTFRKKYLNNETVTPEKLLKQIQSFLSPAPKGSIIYRASSSFDSLFSDPKHQTITGDCNQLVALYIYLYGQSYPITDLRLKLLPQHICLHHNGQDYECTNGTTTLYKKFDRIVQIPELIPVTLLDIADPKKRQHHLEPETILKSAQICHASFHDQRITRKNLLHAYHNAAIASLEEKNYSQSRQFFRKAKNPKGLKAVNQSELSDLLQQIKHCQTVEQYKAKISTIRKIKKLAQKIKQPQIIKFCNQFL